nr:F-box domain-containing protein [Tanacetum cinerariifolium]
MVKRLPFSLFGVFNGHGRSRTAEYFKNNLFKKLSGHPGFIKDIKNALAKAFRQTDGNYLGGENLLQRDTGSTASTAIMFSDRILVANIGDSRVVASSAGYGCDIGGFDYELGNNCHVWKFRYYAKNFVENMQTCGDLNLIDLLVVLDFTRYILLQSAWKLLACTTMTISMERLCKSSLDVIRNALLGSLTRGTKAMILCTISDFLAYGNLSGYKTKGKMACPKNVCESLIGLLLNIQGKTKDGVKVQKDMEAMKSEVAHREIVRKTSTYLPPACLYTNGYKSKPFILAKLATHAFYVKDPNDQRLHVVLYSKRHIVGVENVEDEDEYNQFDELPPFSIGITPSNDVLDDTTYLRSDHNEGLEVAFFKDDNELALVDPPKHEKRGPAKLKDKPTEQFKVELDKNRHAIGKHQNYWATYVGGMSRLRISIVALWEIIKFDLTNNDHKESKLTQCNKAWKRFKTYLKGEYMIKNKKPYEDKEYSFLEKKDWEELCRKHQSPQNMKKRAIGKVYAKQQMNYAHLKRSVKTLKNDGVNANDDIENPLNNENLESDEINISDGNENLIEENNECPQNRYMVVLALIPLLGGGNQAINFTVLSWIDYLQAWCSTSSQEYPLNVWLDPGVYQKESCGLGFDAFTNIYKMVCVLLKEYAPPNKPNMVKKNLCPIVHVFGTNSWREIPQVPSYPIRGKAVFANGCLHWLVSHFDIKTEDGGREVIWFDLNKEEFGLIDPAKRTCDLWS